MLAATAVLVAVMTYPTVTGFDTLGRIRSGDGKFSIWNIGWIGHALLTDPAELYNANIFHPHTGTLAYSELNLVAGVFGSAGVRRDRKCDRGAERRGAPRPGAVGHLHVGARPTSHGIERRRAGRRDGLHVLSVRPGPHRTHSAVDDLRAAAGVPDVSSAARRAGSDARRRARRRAGRCRAGLRLLRNFRRPVTRPGRPASRDARDHVLDRPGGRCRRGRSPRRSGRSCRTFELALAAAPRSRSAPRRFRGIRRRWRRTRRRRRFRTRPGTRALRNRCSPAWPC